MHIFKPFSYGKPGLIYGLLCKCYETFFEDDPSLEEEWKIMWKEYDSSIFEKPETIGVSGFLTVFKNHTIGFASYDPRKLPDKGIIGHNCILPKFRGNGFGKAQIREIIRIFRERNCNAIEAITGEHLFFKPALKMYKSCGFAEEKRWIDKSSPDFRLIKLRRRM